MTGWLEVKNWERFQHYKNRTPPWIKLYTVLLDNYEYTQLEDAERSHLVGIWMLASRNDGKIPDDAGWLERKLSTTTAVSLERLVSLGFLVRSGDASSMVLAPVEKSREEKRTVSKETEPARSVNQYGWAVELIKEKLWHGDTPPLQGHNMGRDLSVVKRLEKSYDQERIERMIRGLRIRVDRGDFGPELRARPITMLLMNKDPKWGARCPQQCEHAYWRESGPVLEKLKISV